MIRFVLEFARGLAGVAEGLARAPLSPIFWIFCALALGALPALPAGAAPAVPTVVLLTSLQTPSVWYRSKNWKIGESLEEPFRQAYEKSGYAIRVVHEAGPRQLAEVLQSPETIGVFWVGHSGSSSTTDGKAARWDDAILDIHGNDLKEIFQRIHPNVKWLGVVGCNAAPIFDHFRAQGFYRSNESLRIQSFDSKVDALGGLTSLLNESVAILGDPARSWTINKGDDTWSRYPNVVARADLMTPPERTDCVRNRGIPLRIIRETRSDSDLVLLWQGRFLGILSADAPDTSLPEVTVYLDEAFFGRSKLKIKALRTHRGEANVAMPPFSLRFESALDSEGWQVFSDSRGNPIGTWSQLYRYTGDLPAVPFVEFEPFRCTD